MYVRNCTPCNGSGMVEDGTWIDPATESIVCRSCSGGGQVTVIECDTCEDEGVVVIGTWIQDPDDPWMPVIKEVKPCPENCCAARIRRIGALV